MILERRCSLRQSDGDIVLTGYPLALAIANAGNTKTIDVVNHTAQFSFNGDPTDNYTKTIFTYDGIHDYEFGMYVINASGINSSIRTLRLDGTTKVNLLRILSGYTGMIVAHVYAVIDKSAVMSYFEAGLITYDYEKSYIKRL